VLVSIMMVILLIDTIEISRRGASAADFTLFNALAISGLRMPNILLTSVPFLVLIAAMVTLLALNKRQELVIIRASGVSAWQFITPLCVGSLLIGAVTVGAINPLSARLMAKAESLEVQFGMSSGASGVIIPWFRQKSADGGVVIIGAARAGEAGRQLAEASFYFLAPDGGVAERVDAPSARLEGRFWLMPTATRYINGKEAEALVDHRIESTIDSAYIAQALTLPQTVSFFDLPRSVAIANSFGLPSGPYAMAWHSLVALPALMVAMTVIAATVSLRFARFGQSSGAILGGIVAGFLLYVVSELSKAFGSLDVVAPVLAAWLPVVVAGFIGVTFLLHREDG
jgi:lipopolysaccharide export system permease protein